MEINTLPFTHQGITYYCMPTCIEHCPTNAKIIGYVEDIDSNPIESVTLELKGRKTKVKEDTSSNSDGEFEFSGLAEDKYIITAKKTGYKSRRMTVSLQGREEFYLVIEMKKW